MGCAAFKRKMILFFHLMFFKLKYILLKAIKYKINNYYKKFNDRKKSLDSNIIAIKEFYSLYIFFIKCKRILSWKMVLYSPRLKWK